MSDSISRIARDEPIDEYMTMAYQFRRAADEYREAGGNDPVYLEYLNGEWAVYFQRAIDELGRMRRQNEEDRRRGPRLTAAIRRLDQQIAEQRVRDRVAYSQQLLDRVLERRARERRARRRFALALEARLFPARALLREAVRRLNVETVRRRRRTTWQRRN